MLLPPQFGLRSAYVVGRAMVEGAWRVGGTTRNREGLEGDGLEVSLHQRQRRTAHASGPAYDSLRIGVASLEKFH